MLIENEIYDCLIIGDGPAGSSCSIYLKRFDKKIILISDNEGGQLTSCGKVDNYLGFFNLTGTELYENFKNHLNYLNIKKKYIRIEKIEKKQNIFFCHLEDKSILNAKTILISSGTRYKKLYIKGEKEFENLGVSYCTTCDGYFFLNKEVAVIGGGNSALDSALILKNIAKKVYIINKNDVFKNCDYMMLKKLESTENVEIIYRALTKELKGMEKLESLLYSKNNKEYEIKISGAFVNIGQKPNTVFLNNSILNNFDEVITSENSSTFIEGLFCAGDVRENNYHQIIIAAGDGAKAAININDYLKKF